MPLPSGIDRASLARRATSITSAAYRAHPSSTKTASTNTPANAGSTATGTDQIYVYVLEAMPNQPQSGDSIATAVAQATRGERTGVRVQSPNGSVYTGSRVRTPQTVVYVLNKQNANIIVIIYAPDPGTQEVADRLARNVGNGGGLNDYPEVKDSLWTLPATLPSGLTLQEVNTLTRAEIESSLNSAGASNGGGSNEEMRRILEQMRQFIPERLTSARYSDSARQDWNAMEFEYGSTFQAWRIWLLAKGVLGLSGSQSTTVLGVDAIYVDKDNGRILIFQKGPYLIILNSPSAAPVDRLIGLANQFQI